MERKSRARVKFLSIIVSGCLIESTNREIGVFGPPDRRDDNMMNDEIFDFVNDTLNKIYSSVQDSIILKIKSELSIYHHAEKKNVKEHEELLIESIVNRIGIRLNEFKIV